MSEPVNDAHKLAALDEVIDDLRGEAKWEREHRSTAVAAEDFDGWADKLSVIKDSLMADLPIDLLELARYHERQAAECYRRIGSGEQSTLSPVPPQPKEGTSP